MYIPVFCSEVRASDRKSHKEIVGQNNKQKPGFCGYSSITEWNSTNIKYILIEGNHNNRKLIYNDEGGDDS